ncbi:MAG: hypothetical protein KDK62_01205 [Chlamydiia bacterium]|nr:hypothetical protein [Chlamydiia bacterium]
MKSFYSLLVAGTLVTHSAEGALPPLYQSTKEIQAILGSPELSKRLNPGETILKIEKIQNGFAIETQENRLEVDVVYQRQSLMGPQSFKLVFKEPLTIKE